MNKPKNEQGQSKEAVVEEFSEELADEALDRDSHDAAMCTCGDAVCGTKCV
ncbi:hypothetical protein BH11PSE3_BH11PSE3_00650 [soil metagenome]